MTHNHNHHFMKIISLVLATIILSISAINGQDVQSYRYNIEWNQNTTTSKTYESLHFDHQSVFNDANKDVSVFYQKLPIRKARLDQARLIPEKTEIIDVSERLYKTITNVAFEFSANISEVRGSYTLHFTAIPVRRTHDGKIERLTTFSIETTLSPVTMNHQRNPDATFTSVLASGDIYKLSVDQAGIFKMDKAFLESTLGISTANLNPKKIKIYGNRGGRVPELNSISRTDDLAELHIFVSGEEDGKFDNGDFILFYAEGADIWKYQNANNTFTYEKNIYDNANYYFLKIDNKDGLRIQKSEEINEDAVATSDRYDMLQHLQEDKVNLLGSFSAAEGTGKDWYGDAFTSSFKEKNYTSKFDFTGLNNSDPIEMSMIFASRSRSNAGITLSIGSKVFSKSAASVAVTEIESLYARKVFFTESSIINETNPTVKLSYAPNASDAEGWLDYIQIVFKKNLNLGTGQFSFRNRTLKNAGVAAYSITNYTNQQIWDITNPFEPKTVSVNNNQIKFRSTDIIKEFVAHNGLNSAFVPTALGKIPNQNIHALNDEDLIIVYHPKFKAEALRLATHRMNHNGYKVLAADVTEVYNEFSGGRVDPGAIRDMARLLLYRNPDYKYMLLFGDGSYDYKGIAKDIPAENYIPVYETDESLDPIDGFPSDDFYGLLGDTEGVNLVGAMDIFIGRLPVKTEQEATTLVDKIIHYDTSPDTQGDWRLLNGYVADDEDGNTHLRDIDDIAVLDENRHPLYNQQKMYADAYVQVSTSGEKRYPELNKQINENVFKGQLSLTYLGHGGPLGWAQERILTVADIQNWTNYNSLTLLVTATCSFGAYDDPSITSPAEHAILNTKGGAIALMTTTRAVYTNSNKQLTDAVHQRLYKKTNGVAPTFGQILGEGKNAYSVEFFRINSRKFSLLGDPSQQISMPDLDVVTTLVNGKEASTATDTINALEKVTIEGLITDAAGNIKTDFNGTIYPTIFDKKSNYETLSNDSGSPKFKFTAYRTIIFKGSASVTNGKWKFSFWVPKNINYSYGKGRISYYATDGNQTDAGGIFSNFIVGGSSQQVVEDDEGPQMDAFMNDENFVSGGITNENPVLLLKLSDDLGINVTGNAIGQDITATLDGDNKNIYILNDFYVSQKDNFNSGVVRFPLSKIAQGKHYIIAKAWDISGNSTEKRIDFAVSSLNNEGLKHVYNYPNPFTSQTMFQFEHDLVNTDLDILVNIYSITGKLIKSITQTKYSTGFRVNDIGWNGQDDFGASLARGVYLYKIHVHSKDLNITRESNFEKLVKL